MDYSQCPKARKSGLVVQEMPDEVLVYDLNSNKAHCLNQTAATVWRACDGNNTVSDIATSFGKGSEDLVWLAIDQLVEKGQSRREVIKKIGLASIIAVPMVASLVAPQNALAASSCHCVNNVQCISGPNGNGSGGTRCPLATCNGSGVCAP